MPPRYEVKDDPTVPPGGVAVVVVPDAAARTRRPAPIDVVIAQQDPEAPYLGPAGWQPVEYLWRSGPLRVNGDTLLVPLGERVTAQVDDFTPLLISFPGLGLSGYAVWRDVTPPSPGSTSGAPAPGRTGGSSFHVEPPISAAPPETTEEPPPEPAPPEPAPIGTPEPGGDPSGPEPEPPIALLHGPQPKIEARLNEAGQTATPRRHALWYVFAAAAALSACIAVAVLWLSGDDGRTAPPPIVPSIMAESQASPPPPPPPVTPDPAPRRQERALAALAAGNIDEALGLLNHLEAEGYGPTLLYLARSLDSVGFIPGLHRQPNDLAAIQFYQRACAGSERPAALEGLVRLERDLRRRADNGESQAAMLLSLQLPNAKTTCQ